MSSHDQLLETLGTEWTNLSQAFAELSEEQWAASTALEPVEAGTPHWTVAELAAHLTYGANMVSTLIQGPPENAPTRDRVGFFVLPRAEVAPLVYRLTREAAHRRAPSELLDDLRDTFTRVHAEVSATDPDVVGPAAFTPMPLREFIPTRIVEAVVHGIDLANATGRPLTATRAAINTTAALLDGLHARRHPTGTREPTDTIRPEDLHDNLRWIEAAAGRTPHPHPDLPLLNS